MGICIWGLELGREYQGTVKYMYHLHGAYDLADKMRLAYTRYLPSKYQPGLTLLSFQDQTRPIKFSMV